MTRPDGLARRRKTGLALPWLLPGSLLLLWWLATSLGWLPAYLLPGPAEIAASGYHYVCGGEGPSPYAGRFLNDARASVGRVILGFGLAVCLGIPLGILAGRLGEVNALLGTSINCLRAVPGICWLPLAMVWFGIGLKTTVFLIALAAFFPIYLNAADGARRVNPLWLQAGAMMGVRRLRGTFAILLPGAMPHMVSGLRLGLGVSWAYLVLGELTGVPAGLGATIMDARMLGRIDMIVVGIIVIAAMGRAADLVLQAVLRLIFKSARRLA